MRLSLPAPWPRRFAPDPYILAILATVALASLAPIRGWLAVDFGLFTKAAIALLFFLHGAKLSREAVLAGMAHWRLHLTVLASTFGLFPLLGLAARHLPPSLLSGDLSTGLLFLCCLPSTVQSSIAFTSLARGNVAAAVCAASASNLIGMFLTPVLVALTLGGNGAGFSYGEAQSVFLQLLAPFIAGQASRKWMAAWLARHRALTGYVDRGSILLVVYGAFSAAVVEGLWRHVSAAQILAIAVACISLLAIVLSATMLVARTLGFDKADEITIVFCGSKKSLASGVPMAGILFPPASVGLMVLPLMIFHQIQLMACAFLAQRYARRPITETTPT